MIQLGLHQTLKGFDGYYRGDKYARVKIIHLVVRTFKVEKNK